jgi:hypothetical protein
MNVSNIVKFETQNRVRPILGAYRTKNKVDYNIVGLFGQKRVDELQQKRLAGLPSFSQNLVEIAYDMISLWRGILMCVSTRPVYDGCQPTRQLLRLALFLLFALQILLLPAAPVTQLRAQPELLAWSAANPATSVQVIVQKAVADRTVEQWVAAAGGHITHELPINWRGGVPCRVVHCPLDLSGCAGGRNYLCRVY